MSNFVWHDITAKYSYKRTDIRQSDQDLTLDSFSPNAAYILNAKNLAPPFLSIFFWIKIDDFKNQCSLVFMPVQKTIVAENMKCVSNHGFNFARKM